MDKQKPSTTLSLPLRLKARSGGHPMPEENPESGNKSQARMNVFLGVHMPRREVQVSSLHPSFLPRDDDPLIAGHISLSLTQHWTYLHIFNPSHGLSTCPSAYLTSGHD